MHTPPPLLLLEDVAVHAPPLHPPLHEVRNCHCPALLQMSTEEPLQVRVPATHAAPPEEEPVEDPSEPPEELEETMLPDEDAPLDPLPDDVDPDGPTVASLPEELPAAALQSHGPRLLPSDAQTWNPAHPPGPAQAMEAPGMQPREAVEPSGAPIVVTEPPPHCAVSTASEANAAAVVAKRRKDRTMEAYHPQAREGQLPPLAR